MRFYNTLAREKQEFVPINGNKVAIYVCGPTVYNFIHIGNARPICVFDTLRRFLEYKGYDVIYVSNFTDVDDKIIKAAQAAGVTMAEISEKYIAEFQKDAHGLNVRDADFAPKVTENMDSILEIISTLVEKGYAYESCGDVYFATEKFTEYGKLSGQPLEDLQAGARIEINGQKRGAMDFTLWKAAKEGEPFWASPWGNGRPGWHIECSAMSRKYIGETIDIHCGGQDLIFPHHENEIAQSECATGRSFAKYWLHNGYINIDNKKMSKSLGNFLTTREIAAKYGYEAIRYVMIQAHYRSQINYSAEIIESARASLTRLYTCKETLERAAQLAQDGEISLEASEIFSARKAQFLAAMEDDLNTADALSAVFELVRELNVMCLKEDISKEQLLIGKALLIELCGVLGLFYEKSDAIPDEILALAEERKAARAAKNFQLADEIRAKITALGFEIEETRQGTKIKKL